MILRSWHTGTPSSCRARSLLAAAQRAELAARHRGYFATPAARQDGTQRPQEERNIFAETDGGKSEAEDEASLRKRSSRVEAQRQAMASEAAWDGDERVQDTILRMVLDKYQPLRVKGGMDGASTPSGQHPADVKMASIQKPSPILGSATFANRNDAIDTSPAIADVTQISALGEQQHEDGRKLAKTPLDKPWRAVYVSPLQPKNGEGPVVPSVYYGKYLGLPTSSSGRVLPKTAKGKDRLKLAGIKTETLPMDDRNKMRAIREGVRRWDRAGRMRGVKEEAMEYRRSREAQRDREAMTEDDLEALLEAEELNEANADGVLREGEEMKLTSSSSATPDAKPGDTVIAMSGGRGMTSVANERIEAAMKTDFFRRNKLRGKPLEKDLHADNPFLKGEERIMNRLIQRQGAAPAWVELNGQVESETIEFRKRLADSWVRRSSRMILATSHLREGLEPLQNLREDTTFEMLEMSSQMPGSAPLTTGQRRLVAIASRYVDEEWEARERAYHEAALKQVCDIIRKYNVIAPLSARKGLLVREWELQRVRLESRMELVRRLSDDLLPTGIKSTMGGTSLASANATSATGSSKTYDIGAAQSGIESDLAAGRAPRTISGDNGSSAFGLGDDNGSLNRTQRRQRSQIGLGFAEFARRTAERARQLVNW